MAMGGLGLLLFVSGHRKKEPKIFFETKDGGDNEEAPRVDNASHFFKCS
jgi:hypothetical protein